MKMKIERTKKGHPALWESGGGYSNTGEATIIAGPNGEKKAPLYTWRRGPLACAHHALFVVHGGDMVITANHHREDFEIRVWRIDQILKEEVRLTLIYEYSRGEWDAELPASLEAAVKAAMQKATCYHCREPHYVRD